MTLVAEPTESSDFLGRMRTETKEEVRRRQAEIKEREAAVRAARSELKRVQALEHIINPQSRPRRKRRKARPVSIA